jgi:predicted RNase H-like HicB family nuclease
MKTRNLTVLIERDEDGYYVATVPALRSCYTQAKSLPTLRKRVLEVIKLCLAHDSPAEQEFVAVERVEIPA